MAGKLDHTIDSMVKYLDTREVKDMQPKERAALYAKTRDLQQQRREMEPKILTAYLKANPTARPQRISLQSNILMNTRSNMQMCIPCLRILLRTLTTVLR